MSCSPKFHPPTMHTHRHAQTQITSQTPSPIKTIHRYNTQPVEPGRMSNEFLRPLSSISNSTSSAPSFTHFALKTLQPHPIPGQSSQSHLKSPHTHLLTHSHTLTITTPKHPTATNHPLHRTLSQQSLGARRTNFVAHSLRSLILLSFYP